MRVLGWGAAAFFALSAEAAPGLSVQAPTPSQPVLIGSLSLRPCSNSRALCGQLDRPMDPTGAVPGRISIHFEYYRHSAAGKAIGTLVATEGGPGYPATGSRDEYLALFEPLARPTRFRADGQSRHRTVRGGRLP